jgi:hypothetical protein
MDYDLFLRLGSRYPAVYLADTCLAAMRQHVAAKSTAQIHNIPLDRRRVLNKLFAQADLPPDIWAFRRTAYSSVSFQQAVVAGRSGHARDIVQALLRSFIESPTYVGRRPFALYLLMRSLLPWWDGNLSPRVWYMLDRLVEHVRLQHTVVKSVPQQGRQRYARFNLRGTNSN